MSHAVDARGKSCPQPVVMTKQALESLKEGGLTVIVDNPTSRDNVERFAKSQGYIVEIEQKGVDYHLSLVKGDPCTAVALGHDKPLLSEPTVVVYVSSDRMGTGEEELGSLLMRAFFKTLKEVSPKPQKIIFINSGVRLTTQGSGVIESLKEIEATGTAILSCGTCLDYYHLKDKLGVGVVSNMFDIATSLVEADRIVKP